MNNDTNDYFGMELLYATQDAGIGNQVSYSGNISAMKWKGMTGPGVMDQRSYRFVYDNMNRLTNALFQANSGTGWNKEVNTLNERLGYDLNGNIISLARVQNLRGLSNLTVTSTPQKTDSLTYTYASGNQVSKIEDMIATTIGTGDFKNGTSATTEYTYDALGSVTADQNKTIDSVAYNVLGKPTRVKYHDGRLITYAYDAMGTKLMSKTYNASAALQTTMEYVNGFVYTNSALSFFSSPEGRVVKNGSNYEYQYTITDHLGNTRVLFTSVAPTAQSVTATFETANQTSEATSFSNYPSTSGINVVATYVHSGSNSQYLNGGYAGMVGVSKSYKVYPGDQVSIQAYASYNAPGSTGSAITNFAAKYSNY
jgi:hypothetical protein